MRNHNKVNYSKKYNEPKKVFIPVEEKTDKVIEEPTIELIETVDRHIQDTVKEEPKEDPKPQEGRVSIADGQKLNLREDMSTDSSVIKALSNNEKVLIDTIYPDWYKVYTESGAHGYVMAQYIELG